MIRARRVYQQTVRSHPQCGLGLIYPVKKKLHTSYAIILDNMGRYIDKKLRWYFQECAIKDNTHLLIILVSLVHVLEDVVMNVRNL